MVSIVSANLNLGIAVPSEEMAPILHHVLQEFTSRGRPEHSGVLFLLKDTGLIANSDAIPTTEGLTCSSQKKNQRFT